MEAWDNRVHTIAKISNKYPQLVYNGLGILLQLKCQYLQRTVTGVVTIMDPIEDALRNSIFSAIFGGEEVSADLREILGHSVKCSGLGIQYPWLL